MLTSSTQLQTAQHGPAAPAQSESTPDTSLSTGRTALCTGRTPLPTGRTPLSTGRMTLSTGRTTLCTGRMTLCTGRTALSTGRTTLCTGRTALSTGRPRPLTPAPLTLSLTHRVTRPIVAAPKGRTECSHGSGRASGRNPWKVARSAASPRRGDGVALRANIPSPLPGRSRRKMIESPRFHGPPDNTRGYIPGAPLRGEDHRSAPHSGHTLLTSDF